MPNRERPVQVKFRVTPDERQMIDRRMAQTGISNMAAYLRRMALNGYILKLDLPELREMVSLIRRYGNNLNQIAKRVNATSRIYADDIEYLKASLDQLWSAADEIIARLAEFK